MGFLVKIVIVRAAKGDTPTVTTLWNGASDNKMLDTIDRERYSVLTISMLK